MGPGGELKRSQTLRYGVGRFSLDAPPMSRSVPFVTLSRAPQKGPSLNAASVQVPTKQVEQCLGATARRWASGPR